MFNSLRGIISEKTGDSICLVSGGIEWEIAVPAADIDRFSPGVESRVFVWLYHREDQMRLFGFADEARRSAFLELLKVEGIGPRAAQKILGGIGQEELERAIETEDLARLEAVPGLGRKTAQKMLLALKGKIVRAAAVPEAASPWGELAEALAEMGYEKRAAACALAKAAREIPEELPAGEREKLLFKEAIVYLSGA